MTEVFEQAIDAYIRHQKESVDKIAELEQKLDIAIEALESLRLEVFGDSTKILTATHVDNRNKYYGVYLEGYEALQKFKGDE